MSSLISAQGARLGGPFRPARQQQPLEEPRRPVKTLAVGLLLLRLIMLLMLRLLL